MKQVFDLGQYYRRRYANLLNESFPSKKVYVYSTGHDRAIMSAQVNLAGLFMPKSNEIWNDNLLWRPVPIHSVPQTEDILLRPSYLGRCDKFLEIYNFLMTDSPEAQEIKAKYGHHFALWEEVGQRKIETLDDAYVIYKTLMSERKPNEP